MGMGHSTTNTSDPNSSDASKKRKQPDLPHDPHPPASESSNPKKLKLEPVDLTSKTKNPPGSPVFYPSGSPSWSSLPVDRPPRPPPIARLPTSDLQRTSIVINEASAELRQRMGAPGGRIYTIRCCRCGTFSPLDEGSTCQACRHEWCAGCGACMQRSSRGG